MEITYDPKKAESNIAKHGVSFDDAIIALFDEHALVREDYDHDEQHFVLLGLSTAGLLVVVYAIVVIDDNGNECIRIISARKATKKEERHYAS